MWKINATFASDNYRRMPKLKDGFRGERAVILPRMVVEQMEKDPLLAALHVTDMGCYPHAAHHYRIRTEGIGQYVLIYCTDGCGWCVAGGKRYAVSANQFIILPAGVPHEYGADEENPWSIYWIHFKGTLAADYMEGGVTLVTLNPGAQSRINQRIALFEEIFLTLKLGYSRDNLRYVSSMFHHFLGSLCYWETYRSAEVTPDKGFLDSIVHYMRENIERKITLTEIASFAGYSPSHFSAIFCKLTGQSPMGYLTQLRIQVACELLDFTGMRVNQVCHKVGIEDPYYFSRLFKRTMGCSPREYRMIKKG